MPSRKRQRAKKAGFASGLEQEIYEDAVRRGIKIEYEPLSLRYEKLPPRGASCRDCGSKSIAVPGTYTPDFRLKNGIYIEAKGYLKAAKRTIYEAVLHSNPDIDLRFIFAQDNWMTYRKKNKYSDWAKKLGVKYYIGKRIPEEWIT